MRLTILVASLSRIETTTNMNNTGVQHPKVHTPIQKRILQELWSLQEAEKVNTQDDADSRHKFLSNFDWKGLNVGAP